MTRERRAEGVKGCLGARRRQGAQGVPYLLARDQHVLALDEVLRSRRLCCRHGGLLAHHCLPLARDRLLLGLALGLGRAEGKLGCLDILLRQQPITVERPHPVQALLGITETRLVAGQGRLRP